MEENRYWLQKQIRLAGEELIRRSETISWDQFDLVQDLKILIKIPVNSRDESQSIKFVFDCANLKELDDLWEGL